jgi:hypothetical protein
VPVSRGWRRGRRCGPRFASISHLFYRRRMWCRAGCWSELGGFPQPDSTVIDCSTSHLNKQIYSSLRAMLRRRFGHLSTQLLEISRLSSIYCRSMETEGPMHPLARGGRILARTGRLGESEAGRHTLRWRSRWYFARPSFVAFSNRSISTCSKTTTPTLHHWALTNLPIIGRQTSFPFAVIRLG